MPIHCRRHGDNIIIFGQTYDFRAQIKAFGARFNGQDKTWYVSYSDDIMAEILKLCAETGGSEIAQTETKKAPPSPSKPVSSCDTDGLTISELMSKLQISISTAFPRAVWVIGEIQNVAIRASGTFFSLAEPKEEAARGGTVTANSMMWHSNRQHIEDLRGKEEIGDVLQDGMKVRCLVQVTLYKDRGQISLQVEDIDPAYSKGELAIAREKLLAELRAKGLDEANKKIEIPLFPFRVGLITAKGTRAISDFTDQLISGGFPGEVILEQAPMQGETVPLKVAAAIKKLGHCDLIVITRGGGSAADLRWFDTREIALAIAESKTAIIAAIGHHEDVCIAEEICHKRQKTPTAAADFILELFSDARNRIDKAAITLAQNLERSLEQWTITQTALSEKLAGAATANIKIGLERLTHLSQAIHASTSNVFLEFKNKLSRASDSLLNMADKQISTKETSLAKLEGLLASKNPTPWLEKGWTQLTGPSGYIKSVNDVKTGEMVKAVLRDGRLDLEVKNKGK